MAVVLVLEQSFCIPFTAMWSIGMWQLSPSMFLWHPSSNLLNYLAHLQDRLFKTKTRCVQQKQVQFPFGIYICSNSALYWYSLSLCSRVPNQLLSQKKKKCPPQFFLEILRFRWNLFVQRIIQTNLSEMIMMFASLMNFISSFQF